MKIQISLHELKQILMEAYDNGWHGSLDLNERNADLIVERYSNDVLQDEPIGSSNVYVGGVAAYGIDPADRSTWTTLLNPPTEDL